MKSTHWGTTLLTLVMLELVSVVGAQESSSLKVEKGRVTAALQNSPIRPFLEELASRTHVAIVTAEEIGDDTISVDLKNIPVEDALRTVLSGYDSFFYYQAGNGGTQSLRTVWVYPMGGAKALRPVPPQSWAGTRELEIALADPDPQLRERAYEALMERPSGHSQQLLTEAVRGRETDGPLRARIFSNAIQKGVIEPDTLAQLARTDGSEEIRWMALDALSQYESAKEVAAALKTDPSEAVRQRAAEIEAEVDAAARRREGASRRQSQQP